MPQKIIIVGPTPPPYYGVANATKLILSSTLKDEFELIHLDTSDRRKSLNFGKIDITNIYLAIKHIFQLTWLIIINRSLIIFIPISQGFLGYFRDGLFILVSAFGKAKIVLQLRGGYFRKYYQESNLIVKWFVRSTLSLSDRMIVLGDSLKKLFDGLVPNSKMRVVPNGVDVNKFTRKKKTMHSAIPVKIVFLSNLIKTKGYFDVLKAHQVLASKYNIETYFAGKWISDEDREETEAFVDENALAKTTHFLGVVNHEEKRKLLSEMDIFVMPTYYQAEGQPWAILEAMASGLPVISTDHGCIAETVIDGITGYLVPKQNVSILVEKMERLISSPSLRASMGHAGYESIKSTFSEVNFIDKLRCVFTELV